MQVSVLASGSKGNCILVKHENTQILVDAGTTYKYYVSCMTELGLEPLQLDGIFISHEHSDHIGGAGVLHRKTNAPLYMTYSTFIYSERKLGNLTAEPTIFSTGDDVIVGDIIVHPFPSSHDATESCNFLICAVGCPPALVIATDLGFPTNLLKNKLSQVSTIVLESNHDVKMLKEGPYEWYLKQRILSRTGHLSNEQATELIAEILNENHRRIILAHLSEINNTPEIAYKQMSQMLKRINADVELVVSEQDRPTPLFEC